MTPSPITPDASLTWSAPTPVISHHDISREPSNAVSTTEVLNNLLMTFWGKAIDELRDPGYRDTFFLIPSLIRGRPIGGNH